MYVFLLSRQKLALNAPEFVEALGKNYQLYGLSSQTAALEDAAAELVHPNLGEVECASLDVPIGRRQ